ncbi:MAG TPA: FkbM family methyltransferase [Candidatus Omnitrophota bacterium]|nr:FkbM family methyltransferase [Candidatus Omnitrophota bacterium]
MFFDFLLAGMIGDAWYGKSNHLTYMEQIARCIHDGDVVLDLGAHQGFFTMIYRLLVGAEGAVYAVEPFDHFTDVIRFNASLNKFSNVYVLNCGLDEEKSIHKITSISARSAEKAKNQFSNYVISLHLNDFSVLKPDFVKIDIEGFELDAFRHAEVFLECKPMFLLSIHPCFIEARKENYQEIFDCLQKHDYLFGKVDVKGNFTERTIPSLAHPVSFEVLAIPRSKIPKIKKEA